MFKLKKMEQRLKIFYIIFFSIGFVSVIFLAFLIFRNVPIGLDNRPEQDVQTEITAKRIERLRSSGRKSLKFTNYTYIVSFKFSDGAVKELEVDHFTLWGYPKTAPYSSVYDELNEGEPGILTYKEIKNNETNQYENRKFISFKKDAEYGGTKVEMIKRTDEIVIVTLCISFAYLILCVILSILAWVKKNKQLSNKQKKRMNKEKIRKQVIKRKQKRKAEELRKKAKEEKELPL